MRTTEPACGRPFAIVTGVTTRLGFALAELCAAGGYDLLVASADDCLEPAASRLRRRGGLVEAVRVDLADPEGVDELCAVARVLGRPVDALIVGPTRRMPGPTFLDQSPAAVADAFDLSVLGPVRLTHQVARAMRQRGQGRILLAEGAPIADASPVMLAGANGFLAGFAEALRRELDGAGVTVTSLASQARLGGAEPRMSPDERALALARLGFAAMMRSEAGRLAAVDILRTGRA